MLLKAVFTAALGLVAVPAFAASCEATIDSTDQMTFDKKDIQISKSCTSFTLTLTHSGNLPVQVMGHNWVLTEADDLKSVAGDGMSAGVDAGYLKANDKRVIAHTRLIGAGDKDSVTFDASALDPATSYLFFCSFPGHVAMMQGKVTLVD